MENTFTEHLFPDWIVIGLDTIQFGWGRLRMVLGCSSSRRRTHPSSTDVAGGGSLRDVSGVATANRAASADGDVDAPAISEHHIQSAERSGSFGGGSADNMAIVSESLHVIESIAGVLYRQQMAKCGLSRRKLMERREAAHRESGGAAPDADESAPGHSVAFPGAMPISDDEVLHMHYFEGLFFDMDMVCFASCNPHVPSPRAPSPFSSCAPADMARWHRLVCCDHASRRI